MLITLRTWNIKQQNNYYHNLDMSEVFTITWYFTFFFKLLEIQMLSCAEYLHIKKCDLSKPNETMLYKMVVIANAMK